MVGAGGDIADVSIDDGNRSTGNGNRSIGNGKTNPSGTTFCAEEQDRFEGALGLLRQHLIQADAEPQWVERVELVSRFIARGTKRHAMRCSIRYRCVKEVCQQSCGQELHGILFGEGGANGKDTMAWMNQKCMKHTASLHANLLEQICAPSQLLGFCHRIIATEKSKTEKLLAATEHQPMRSTPVAPAHIQNQVTS
jgi:hypothetical protein